MAVGGCPGNYCRGHSLTLSTVQAQEKGEHVQVLDDASYALDGMAPSCGIGTQRESITTLAEILSTRTGRAALRYELGARRMISLSPRP